jgi:hypothetical protein
MNKRLQEKRRNPVKEKGELIRLPASNVNPMRQVKNSDNVNLPPNLTPWYPIFRAKKHDPL